MPIVNEIQETFLEVHAFCTKITEEFNVSRTISPARKSEIKEKAETARLVLDTLSKSLTSILSREGEYGENKIENVLKQAGIRFDDNKPVEYRNIIAQYPRQANILLDAVNTVIEAVK